MNNDPPVTVHMIGNAHLDPVWLWHWQRGADECLATCRAACDLLDDYPDVIFTRGEAWVYEQVRTLDPGLFERIRGHIQGGRWAVVNGWWVQTDEAVSLRLVPGVAPGEPEQATAPRFVAGGLENGKLRVEFGSRGIAQVYAGGEARLKRPVLLVALADGSDTWSHDCDRYSGPVQALGEFGAPQPVENGPLRATVRLDGRIGSSSVRLFVSLARDAARVDVRMQTNYRETMTVLKASVMPVLGAGEQRRDRIAGGWWPRACDGREVPVHHALTLEDADKRRFGMLFPDSFAADVAQTQTLRVTLLRNSVHAYSSYARLPQEDIPALRERFGTDEGPQALRFSLALDEAATEAALENDLVTCQRPPWIWDDFQGRARLDRFE